MLFREMEQIKEMGIGRMKQIEEVGAMPELI